MFRLNWSVHAVIFNYTLFWKYNVYLLSIRMECRNQKHRRGQRWSFVLLYMDTVFNQRQNVFKVVKLLSWVLTPFYIDNVILDDFKMNIIRSPRPDYMTETIALQMICLNKVDRRQVMYVMLDEMCIEKTNLM